MPYVSAIIDRIFVVRWRGGPFPGELDEILKTIADHRKMLGRPLVYLTLIGPDADVPPDDVRPSLDRFAVKLRDHVDFTHVVVEATGFLGAAHRSLITANWRRRQETGFAMLHKTLDEALRRIAADLKLDLARLSADVRAKGMMS